MKTGEIILILSLLFIWSCGEQNVKEEDLTNFNKMDWLLGIWEGKQGDADIYESWRKKNFRIMEGISYTTQDERRVYAQTMRIEQNNNNIFLIIKFNEGEENILRAETIDDDKIIFVNTEEGFPHTVTYKKSGNGINVSIKGEDESTPSTELTYKRTGDA